MVNSPTVAAESVAHHARRAGAFQQDIGRKSVKIGKTAEMESAAQFVDEFALAATIVVIEHVNVEAALGADQGGEQPDRPGTGDEQRVRPPRPRALADALGMIPSLGDDAGRGSTNTPAVAAVIARREATKQSPSVFAPLLGLLPADLTDYAIEKFYKAIQSTESHTHCHHYREYDHPNDPSRLGYRAPFP